MQAVAAGGMELVAPVSQEQKLHLPHPSSCWSNKRPSLFGQMDADKHIHTEIGFYISSLQIKCLNETIGELPYW